MRKKQKKRWNNQYVARGGVYIVDLNPVVGSEQGGCRPCVCVSNDLGNAHSLIAHFAPLTTQAKLCDLPTHYILSSNKYRFLSQDSMVLIEQLTCKSVQRVRDFLGRIDNADMEEISECIMQQFDLGRDTNVSTTYI